MLAPRQRPTLDTRSPAETRDVVQERQRAWLRDVETATGMSLSAVAVASGISDTTLTRIFQSGYKGVISPAKVQAVSDFSGIAGPGAVLAQPKSFLREDGIPFEANSAMAERAAVEALLAGDSNRSAWRMSTDVLRLAGVHLHDVVIVDQTAEPRDGDIVCAQIEHGFGAKTVFRVLQRPALVGATLDMLSVRPEFIDGQRVRIAGVVVQTLRSRN